MSLVVPLAEDRQAEFQTQPFEEKSDQHHAGDDLRQFEANRLSDRFTVSEVKVGNTNHAEVHAPSKNVASHPPNGGVDRIGHLDLTFHFIPLEDESTPLQYQGSPHRERRGRCCTMGGGRADVRVGPTNAHAFGRDVHDLNC